MAVYLDCNATTPVEPRVQEIIIEYLAVEFGNAGSRTHAFGTRAQHAVQQARDQVAAVVKAKREEVIFTSGATESNNLALLGFAKHGKETGRQHIVSTMIEHKAVLEPLAELEKRGFTVTLVPPTAGGWVDPAAVREALRKDTLLVSVIHVNNETGVIQPLPEIGEVLRDHPAYLHVDAAQGFGKEKEALQQSRIDLISISGHKIYGPKGIGALVVRRRGFRRPPLIPLLFGGGQERGLRPGTLPVALIAGLGLAAELADREMAQRADACRQFRQHVLGAVEPLGAVFNGDPARTLPHVVNLSFPGIDSEAVMVALKDVIAISNGSACTSHSYEPSHVLQAMGCSESTIQGALRLSWCHMTEAVDWEAVTETIQSLR